MHKKHNKHSNRIHVFRILKQCQCPTKPSQDLGHLNLDEFNQQILPHETPSICLHHRAATLQPFGNRHEIFAFWNLHGAQQWNVPSATGPGLAIGADLPT